MLARLRAHAALASAVAIGLVGAPYLLFLKSPLRLAGDEIAYLSIAARMAGGFPAVDLPIDYPRGYPALIAGLERVGLGVPWAFVGLNLVFLAVGTGVAYLLLRRVLELGRLSATLVCVLLLLSRIVVWTAATPRSDVPFLGLAMLCLLFLVLAREREAAHAWAAIGLAVLLAAAAIEVRTIGVALLPAVLFACLARPEVARLLRRPRKRALPAVVLGIVVLAGIAVAAVPVVRGTGYLSAASAGWQTDGGAGTVASEAARELKAELSDVGELVLNVRRGRAVGALDGVYPLVGALALAVALAGAWTRRRKLAVTEVFVASTALILFAWPGNDSRLWLPAFPLLLGYIALAVRRHARRLAVPAVALVCATAFGVAGAVTLARSVSIGLSGSSFPSVWAESAPWTGPAYELAFRPDARVDRSQVDARVLLLLRRYEPRAGARS